MQSSNDDPSHFQIFSNYRYLNVLAKIHFSFSEVDKNVIPGSAGIWASYPNGGAYNSENEDLLSDPLPSTVTLFFDQLLGTALLLIIILSVTDERNMKVPSGLVPLFIGLGLTAIHLSFAFNAGCAINPARDFSP